MIRRAGCSGIHQEVLDLMAGFGLFPPKRPPVTPHEVLPPTFISAENPLPEGLTLVSQEDIYYNRGEQAVLLMKAGQVVTSDQIPILIKFGVTPSQFRIEGEGLEEITQLMSPPTVSQILRHTVKEKVLIADSDEKSIKRLTDCLMRTGIALGNIHPVPVLDNLSWALDKYEPTLVFLDFTLESGKPGLGRLLKQLQEYAGIKEIVVTLSLPAEKETLRDYLTGVAESYGAKVLLKPFSRFMINDLLAPYL